MTTRTTDNRQSQCGEDPLDNPSDDSEVLLTFQVMTLDDILTTNVMTLDKILRTLHENLEMTSKIE